MRRRPGFGTRGALAVVRLTSGGIEMRRLLDGRWSGACIVALLALPAWSVPGVAAERTMRFRPVPAESASTLRAPSEAPPDSTIGRRHGRAGRSLTARAP